MHVCVWGGESEASAIKLGPEVRESSGGSPTLFRFSWLLFVDARLA